MHEFGKWLVVLGLTLALIGAFLWIGFGKDWLGRLIHIERGNFSLHFPIITCIILSIILTIILNLFRR